jgi:hypothetical protein
MSVNFTLINKGQKYLLLHYPTKSIGFIGLVG